MQPGISMAKTNGPCVRTSTVEYHVYKRTCKYLVVTSSKWFSYSNTVAILSEVRGPEVLSKDTICDILYVNMLMYFVKYLKVSVFPSLQMTSARNRSLYIYPRSPLMFLLPCLLFVALLLSHSSLTLFHRLKKVVT